MKKNHIIIVLFTFILNLGKAQVKDISFTLSPAAEYTFWDNKAGLEDNFLVGGKLGFGFGEYIELRGIYMQSLDQKTSFEDFGIANYDAVLFNAQDVTIKRWGGEFKANLGTKMLKPYFTLGTGVQNIEVDGQGNLEQIYASGGLGIKFNIAKRLVFALEGKNTTYKFNAGSNLLSENDQTDFGVTDADFENKRLSNWSILGSLQLYLGGRKPGELSDLDRAYLQKFKGGFKGLQFIIEPSMAFTNFDDSSLFRNTYWLGGYAGVDFNEYIGVRGFYFQATENEKLSTSFDDLSMYGAEFRARLNDGNGVVPFLILGGGYINPSDTYITSTAIDGVNIAQAEGGAFASGGLGLNIPLGKHVLITGGARAMLTSGDNVVDINNTDDLQTSIFYNAGLKFTLGKKSKSPNDIYQNNLASALDEQQLKNDQKLSKLNAEYTQKIEALNQELKKAYDSKDVAKAVEILEEKKVAEQALQEVKNIEKVQEIKGIENSKKQDNINAEKQITVIENDSIVPLNTETNLNKSELIQMTPAEFESLIERILENVGAEEKINSQMPTLNLNPNTIEGNQQQQMQFLNERINVLEKLLLEINEKKSNEGSKIENKVQANLKSEKVQVETEKEGENNLDSKSIEVEKLKIKDDTNGDSKSLVTEEIDTKVPTKPLEEENNEKPKDSTAISNNSIKENTFESLENEYASNTNNLLSYDHSKVFIGGGFGNLTTANLSGRLYYTIKNTRLQLMPEVFVGLGNATIWGATANIIYPFSVADGKFNPYLGAGGGIGDFGLKTNGIYNIILGTSLPLLDNNLYVDYTMRNSFDYNQLSLGYKIKF